MMISGEKNRMKDNIKLSLIYPSIKDDSLESKVDVVKTDILPLSVNNATYFSSDWRFENVVIDCLANKYRGKIEDYPTSDDDADKFAIGITASKQLIKQSTCTYIAKMVEIIHRDNRINEKNIIGFHLYDIDRGEDNSQKFILLTKKKIFIRFNTKLVEEYDFDELIFCENSIQKKGSIESIDDSVVDYAMDVDFINYIEDIKSLHIARIEGINETHPVVTLSLEKKERYLSFLVDLAITEGRVEVFKLLKLEFLSREFKITTKFLVKCICKSAKSNLSDSRISGVFSDILRNVLHEEQRYIFYQEILELILNDVGDISKLKIVQLLRNRKYAGEQFVNSYIEFLRNRNKANNALKSAITAVDCPVINYGNIYKYLRYNSALDLQFLKIGVINNGKE